MSFKQIFEGWRNNLLPPESLKEQIQQVSDERLAICRGCMYNSVKAAADGTKFSTSWRPDEHCISCGCTLAAKTKCLSCACPLGKWAALLSNTDDDALTKALHGTTGE